MKIDGGCYCGSLTYEAEIDPDNVGICHCTDCQILSGTAFRTIVAVPETDFLMTGEPTLYTKIAESGAEREMAFCSSCGSAIYSASVGVSPKVYSVRLGTANQRNELVPKFQYWTRSALNWLPDVAGILKYEKQKT